MALTYIETVRLLMGDLDEGDNNFFTADQWAHFFRILSYNDADDNRKLSLVEVAIEALRTLSLYHADQRPERSKKVDDRVDQLSRWPTEKKELYICPGEPEGESAIFRSTIYSALSDDTTFTEADFVAGNFSASNVIPVSGGHVDRYLAFWQGAGQDNPTLVRPRDKDTNRIDQFEDPEPLTVGGIVGEYYRSTNEIAAADLGQDWVVSRLPQPSGPGRFFLLGWTRGTPANGISMDTAEALVHVVSQTDLDNAARADGDGPLTFPTAHFPVGAALGWGYYFVAVESGRGEPPGGVANNGVNQGTGLLPNDTTGLTDADSGVDLEIWIWGAALNVGLVGNGSFALTLLGYTD